MSGYWHWAIPLMLSPSFLLLLATVPRFTGAPEFTATELALVGSRAFPLTAIIGWVLTKESLDEDVADCDLEFQIALWEMEKEQDDGC